MERTNLEKAEDTEKPKENFFITYNDLRDGKDKLLEKIKKHIEKPNLSAARVGKYCFEYFLKNEVVV